MAQHTLTFIRHGQYLSVGDDPPLSDLGQRQAAATAAYFLEQPITTIHHSTMQRAVETAHIIAQTLPGIPLVAHDTLRECVPTIPPAWATLFAEQTDPDYRPEQVAVAQAQLETAYATLFQPIDQDKHELVVCHGNVLRYLVCRALNINQHAWLDFHPVYHCSLTQILVAPHILKEAIAAGMQPTTLFSFNDVQHLPVDQRTFS